MSEKRAELSKNEWFLMKICWTKKKLSVREAYEKALKKKKWEYQTVKTMMDRLTKKGYLSREKFGPIYLYSTKVKKSQVIKDSLDNFVEVVLDNQFLPIFTHLVNEKKISEEELQALQKLIEEKKSDEKSV